MAIDTQEARTTSLLPQPIEEPPLNPEATTPEERKIVLQEKQPVNRKFILPDTKVSARPSGDAREQRMMKAAFALGEIAPSRHFMEVDFAESLEQETRKQAAIVEAMNIRESKHQLIQELIDEATASGQKFTLDEQDFILGLTQEELVSEETILEKMYAQKYLTSAVTLEDPEIDDVLEKAQEVDTFYADQILDFGYGTVTNQELAVRNLQDMKDLYDKTGYYRLGLDFFAGIVPLVTWQNVVDRADVLPKGSRWTGTNIRQTVEGLTYLPPDEYKRETQRILHEIAQENIVDALYLAQALVGYTYSDEHWDNITFGLDVYDVTTLGGAVAAGALLRLIRRARSVTRANATTHMTVEDGLAAAGKLEHAGIEIASARLKNPLDKVQENATGVMKRIAELGKLVPALLDGNTIARNAGVKGNEYARRIVSHVQANKNRLMQVITDSSVLQRLGPQAQDIGFEIVKRDILRDHHKLVDAIIEMRPVREASEIYGGTDRVDVFWGRMDASSFEDFDIAEHFARKVYKFPKGSYHIVEDEGNILIRTSRNMDEASLEMLDARVLTENPQVRTPIQDFLTSLGAKRLSGWASPDDILSPLNVGNRKIATFGMNRVRALFQEVAEDVKLPKKGREALNKVVEANHFQQRTIKHADGTVEKVQGAWHETIAQLERGWKKANGRLPTEAETKAYFNFKTIMDMDWMFRNLAVYKDKARLGIMQKAVSFMQEVEGKLTRVTSPFFEGREIEALPHYGRQPFNVMWMNKKGKVKVRLSTKLVKEEREELEALIGDGSRILQTVDGGGKLRKTMKTGPENIDYVIAKDISTKPLSTQQVAYHAGGHRMYPEFGRFVKQANVSYSALNNRMIRRGDTTAHWDPSVKGGDDLAAAYNFGRQLLLDGATPQEINRFVKTHLPFYKSGKEFSALFRGLDGAVPDAPFDVRAPFVATRPGQGTEELLDMKGTFGVDVVDLSKSEHNLDRKMFTGFTQDRSDMLTRVRREGTEDNPVFKLEPAPLVDPMHMLSRSADQLVNSRYFDDYKHSAIENWATRHGRFVDVDPEELRADPLRYLIDPKWKETSEAGALAAAKADRRSIITLMNLQNDAWIDYKNIQQKVVDTISARAGKATEELVDSWRWYDPNLRPAQWARSVAFHAYLGYYATKQFKLQASAALHVFAITGDPILSSRAVLNYGLVRAALASHENKAKWAAKMAKKAFGMPEDQFMEMYQLYRRAGVHEFRGETAQLDSVFNHGPTRTGFDKFQNAAQVFFREGNLVSRGSSFMAAYMQFRKANPAKKITDADLHTILRRTSVMSVDQTRDSINPRMETGIPKFMNQFFTFQFRLSDQMIGTRLTTAERIRVMAVWSLMYGPPAGVLGTAIGRVWPVYDHVREEALAHGWDPNDTDPVTRFAIEGSLPMMVEWATGQKLDVTASYGPGGVDFIRNVINGDDTLLEMAAGAAGSFWGDQVLRSAQPFFMYLTDVFVNPGAHPFQVMPSDYEQAFRSISSVDAFFGAYYAINLQEKWAKSGSWTDKDVDPMAGIFSALTGWQPAQVTDAYRKMTIAKHRDKARQGISQLALAEFKKGLYEKVTNNDPEAMAAYFNRAERYMEGAQLDANQRANILARAIRENSTAVEEINRDFISSMPEQYRRRLMEIEKRRLQGDN